jgi:hypothetical protein
MALWPNNRRDIMGWSPTNIDGNFWFKQHLLPWAQRQTAVFTTLAESSSFPEGMAPHGAILHPIIAGGMTSAATLDLDASGTMLSASTLTSTWTGDLTASASLSQITSMTGTWTGDLSTNTPTLNLTLTISGSWTIDLDGAAALAIIDPMTGTFAITFDGAADLKGRLRMDGEWSTSDTPLTVAYEGAIYVAPWGTDGVSYPSGTATSPVFSLDSAIYLCNKYSLKTIYLRGSYVLDEDEEGLIDNFEFKGWGPLLFCKLNLGGLLLDTVHFHDLVLEGTLNTTAIGGSGWQSSIARVQFDGCYLQSITNLQGVARGCQIDGTTSIAPGGWFSSSDTVIEGDFTVFNMQSTAGTTLSVDVTSGWAQVDNMVTGCLAEFNFKGGEITFLGGCTGGEYYLEGVGTLFDESNGGLGGALTKKENHFVWDEIIEGSESGAGMLRISAAVAAGNAANLDGNASFQSMDGGKTRVAGTRSGGTRTITTRDGSP